MTMMNIPGHKFEIIMDKIILGGKGTYGIDRQFLHLEAVSVYRGSKVIDLEEIRPEELR